MTDDRDYDSIVDVSQMIQDEIQNAVQSTMHHSIHNAEVIDGVVIKN